MGGFGPQEPPREKSPGEEYVELGSRIRQGFLYYLGWEMTDKTEEAWVTVLSWLIERTKKRK
jgi:hypothetical protein